MSFLLAASAGCGTLKWEKIDSWAAVSGSSSQGPAPVSGENGRASSGTSSESSQPDVTVGRNVTALRQAVDMDRYGLVYRSDGAGTTYRVNGKMYLSLTDVSSLFRTQMIYDPAQPSISFGDGLRTRIETSFDLSEYPNLEDIVGSSPSEVWTEDSIVAVFQYSAKSGSCQSLVEQIGKKLKSGGFSVTTEKQFGEIPNIGAFLKGGYKNTYIKNNHVQYGNGELSSQTYQSILQILSGDPERAGIRSSQLKCWMDIMNRTAA